MLQVSGSFSPSVAVSVATAVPPSSRVKLEALAIVGALFWAAEGVTGEAAMARRAVMTAPGRRRTYLTKRIPSLQTAHDSEGVIAMRR